MNNNIFLTQIELIINNNLFQKKIIDEELFLKSQENLLIILKNSMSKDIQ